MTRDEYLILVHGMRREMQAYSFKRGCTSLEAEEAVDRALHYIESHVEVMLERYSPRAAIVVVTASTARDLVRRRVYRESFRAMTHVHNQLSRDALALQHDVRAAFDTLPPLIQWVAWKVVVEGHTWEHIAGQLGMKQATLKSRVLRALYSLRPRLAAYAPARAKTTPNWSSHRLMKDRPHETGEKGLVLVS